ncbi:TPA: hypothetical protein R4216_003859 [Citrobacter freundii]|nr:hypothetical protein [Citrobacter freundii]HED3839498.1 hypothetical protein [Citrobacter freundii]HED3844733.1 hypothetical protein [Citrobacter freundii]
MKSIEEKISDLEFSKTRAYFNEVYSSYNNGNYRSAIVMLWSVMVCDAIYKLEKLDVVYSDKTAKKILDHISKMQTKDPLSPSWEIKLFEMLFEEKSMIGTPEIVNIRELQKKRHLCAHPIMSEERVLYEPNKETVKSLMLNALNDFLLYKAYYGKGVFEILASILESESAYYTSRKNVEKLISSYQPRMAPHVIYQVFKSFWAISFKTENDKCNENRQQNSMAAVALAKYLLKDPKQCESIRDDVDYFSKLSTNIEVVKYLFVNLCHIPQMFKMLSEPARERLLEFRNHEENEDVSESQVACYIASMFTFDDMAGYIEFIKSKIANSTISNLDKNIMDFISFYYEDYDGNSSCMDLLVEYVLNSWSYDMADSRFDFLFKYYIEKLNAEQIDKILSGYEINSQIYDRRRAAEDRRKLQAQRDKL